VDSGKGETEDPGRKAGPMRESLVDGEKLFVQRNGRGVSGKPELKLPSGVFLGRHQYVPRDVFFSTWETDPGSEETRVKLRTTQRT